MWWYAIAALAAIAAAGLYFHFADLEGAGALRVLLAASLVSGLSALVVLHQRYHRTLARLHRNILRAQEGILEPLATAVNRERPLGRLIADYNAMIITLRSMFATVEECQGRVLNERNKINAILQSLPGALLSVDDNLRVNSANKQAEELFGDKESVIGRTLFELLQLGEGDRAVLRDAFLYKQQVCNQEVKLQVGDALRWFSLNLSFLTEQDSDMGAVITLQDMTNYKQLQESVANREKLVAMGQLAAGVAHELNTPLGNILGYSQLIQDGAHGHEKLAHYAKVISDETRRCSRIVQDLLNYARKDQCHGETCDINTLIQDLVETFFINCRMKRQNIGIVLELQPGELIVEGGCGQLDIVLSNVLLNAIQALEGVIGPAIRIRTVAEENGFVVASIEDNGPGVAPEHRNRIFDPFYSTKEVGSGSGLGLSISQAILSKRGGFIKYDSGYQNGARFLIKLPLLVAEKVLHAGTA